MIWLDNSRIIAIFAVVVLHTVTRAVTWSDVGSEYWWIGNFYYAFVRWCVPVFVMISGALLLDPDKKESLTTFYRKRLSRILVPILFWSVFFLLWAMVKGTIKGDAPSWVELSRRLISARPYYHMWFLYMITILYLFTPFFRKMIANSTQSEITIFIMFTFFLAALNAIDASFFPGSSRLFTNWFLSYIPYFFLGYLIRIDNRNFSKNILWAVFLLSSCLTAVGCYIAAVNKGLDAGLYFHGYLSITVIAMSISVMYLFKSLGKPIISEKFTRTLSLLTLGIYFTHPIILETLVYLRLSPSNFCLAISIPVIAIIVFGFSLIGSWVIYQVPYLRRVI
jgi:surface polysaccharide O-acyltransferase-like enzyme